MLEKRHQKKLHFAKELYKLKMELIQTIDKIQDKRHEQAMVRIEKAFELFKVKSEFKQIDG